MGPGSEDSKSSPVELWRAAPAFRQRNRRSGLCRFTFGRRATGRQPEPGVSGLRACECIGPGQYPATAFSPESEHREPRKGSRSAGPIPIPTISVTSGPLRVGRTFQIPTRAAGPRHVRQCGALPGSSTWTHLVQTNWVEWSIAALPETHRRTVRAYRWATNQIGNRQEPIAFSSQLPAIPFGGQTPHQFA